MPVPTNYPLFSDRMTATLVNGVAPGTNSLGAPWTGRVQKVGITIGSTVTTAGTLSVDVAGVAIPGATNIPIPTSTPVDSNASTISVLVNAPCNEDDPINFVLGAGGAGGGIANVFAVVRAGS